MTGERSEGDINLGPRRAAWAERQVGPNSRALVERDARAFLRQSLSTPCLSAVRKAEGIWIEDADGRRFMDFHGNSAHHIGYAHPRLKEALQRQLDDLTFAPRRFACEEAAELAERLASLSPTGPGSKVLFAPGGSEGIEIALKLARVATGRFKTVSFWDAFHGAGFGAVSVGGESVFRSHGIGPLLAGTEHVAPFACSRCPYGFPSKSGAPDLDACRMACARMVRYALEKEGDVAAVVAEPVRAVPYVPPPGFWAAVRQACDETGALLIFDEIPTGLGKTGALFSHAPFGATPDILVLGKALGGAMLPLAAVIARDGLDVAADRALGHYTHEKNPLLARAGLTTLDIIRDEGLVERAAELGAYARERLEEMAARVGGVSEVRGAGLLIGVELVRPDGTPDADRAEAVLYAALERGLSFKTTMGSVLTLSPPLTIARDDLDRAMGILEECLAACRP
ncbi:MAG TPA: aspartate aminotransferase family protein [Azospirillum sp.]|nr:aspartate aminotransferase family protein [Azospirillum sp.]